MKEQNGPNDLRGIAHQAMIVRRLQELEGLHPEVSMVAAELFRDRTPPQIKGSGYVVKSLEAVLWAFHDVSDFRDAGLKSVNLGDDADTTGAVCGQLADACWGETGIPHEWLTGHDRAGVERAACWALAVSVGASFIRKILPQYGPRVAGGRIELRMATCLNYVLRKHTDQVVDSL